MQPVFKDSKPISKVAENILRKRYFTANESSWEDVVKRVVDYVLDDSFEKKNLVYDMMLSRHFIPNSPCLVNSGKENGGLLACFVVDMQDSIESIYKTKLDFALIAKKGGGCGTTLSNLRPKNSKVNGSAHGYSGGPIDFFNTICHDMEVMTQAGFRNMAMMGTMSVYHPDIIQFITAKTEENKMTTTNISVVVDNKFMEKVLNNEYYQTFFRYPDRIEYGEEYSAQDIFDLIVENAWRNGEPGILFYDSINNSPYKYSGVEILATNPCGEQPLPPNGSCNLGSLDISRFYDKDLDDIDYAKLDLAVRLSIRFLDAVIDKNCFPTKDIEETSLKSRQVGLGIMGLADYFLMCEIEYGSEESLVELEKIMSFIYNVAKSESEILGEEKGIPEWCKFLPEPRRNITLISIAPTGTISLLAGCSSGIEPIFSEITVRNDKTGSYTFVNNLVHTDYFKCAVSSNGAKEVTWKEHINIQSAAQKYCDSGVSKTINFPSHTKRKTIEDSFIFAWQSGCKGITVYRNGSRNVEVLSPKNLKKDRCPVCDKDIIVVNKITKCSDPKCTWSMEGRK